MADKVKPVAVYYEVMCYQKENLDFLAQYFDVHVLPDPSADSVELLSRASVCFAPLGYKVDANKINRCPKLKIIISNTTGVPHIDMEAAENSGIHVCSLKDEQEFLDKITPTAEHTWGLLLALTRNTIPANSSVMHGLWNRRPYGGYQMLSRMRLGIVGLGRLGRRVARYGEAFDMQVKFYDSYVTGNNNGFQQLNTLQELVKWADVLSLHVPANDETEKLISKEIFSLCREGMWLINTARGEIIDETALLEALNSGQLSGAALDVIDGEFEPGFVPNSHPLVEYAKHHDNLLLTPHIGGSTRDAWFETERRVIDMAIARYEEIS